MYMPPMRNPRSFDIRKTIRQAVSLKQQGKLEEAERLCRSVLNEQPLYFDALHLLGVLRGEREDYQEAVKLISLSVAQNPSSAEAHSNLGIALLKLERHQDAVASFDRALAIEPDYAAALNNRANILMKLGRYDEAVATYDRLIALRSNDPIVLYRQGNALHALGRYEEAIARFEQTLALRPTHADAMNNLGTALLKLGRHEEAVARFERALKGQPDDFSALVNQGTALAGMERYEEAVSSYDKALAINPDHAELLYNRGQALMRARRYDEAITSYGRALAVKQDYAEASGGRAFSLYAVGRYVEAIASFDQALAIRSDYAIALQGRGDALARLRRHEDAAISYERALSLEPDLKYLLGSAAYSRARFCDWRDEILVEKRIVDEVRAGKPVISPFSFLSISESPADQLACASTHVRERFAVELARRGTRRDHQHERIRLAYISADFSDHAMSNLMVGLFEQHDRARFEVSAISFGPDRNSEMRSRLIRSFEQFIDVRPKSDKMVFEQLRELQVDIAVDLMGFTRNCRPEILARRPAPIQVNYLGYPGTMGADFIDYIIADEFVIPRSEQHNYSEKVVYLPDCFQANDSKRKIGERTPTRTEAGLPETGFVFCCFNNGYKIKPEVFDVWMRILKRVEHSVLWLLGESDTTMANLRREAQSRGVKPDRLVFAKRVKTLDYLARYRLADLFLDTLPFNAGTTASDALWAGLPLVTCAGKAFAARMAGSLLHAVGLSELVTRNLEDYEALALKLATDAELLRDVREKLAHNRFWKPLFDTDRFRRHIEAAYTQMWEIHQQGEEPRSFAVMAVD